MSPKATPPPELPPCPKCKSPHVTIATTTDWFSYLRCEQCFHTWSIETAKLPPTPRKKP